MPGIRPRSAVLLWRPLPTWASLVLVWLVGLVGTGCADRVQFSSGAACTLTTDCAEPLVCRLDRCRAECRTARDCTVGFACVEDPSGLRVCQVPSDLNCLVDSDCSDFLTCRDKHCVNACEEDRDCPPGQECQADAVGVNGCVDPPGTDCVRNSDCSAPLVCAVDRLCRVECRETRDCNDPQVCAPVLGTYACVDPPDAGP